MHACIHLLNSYTHTHTLTHAHTHTHSRTHRLSRLCPPALRAFCCPSIGHGGVLFAGASQQESKDVGLCDGAQFPRCHGEPLPLAQAVARVRRAGLCVCVCVCVCVCTYIVCVYIHTYTYSYIHIYTYHAHTNTHRERERERERERQTDTHTRTYTGGDLREAHNLQRGVQVTTVRGHVNQRLPEFLKTQPPGIFTTEHTLLYYGTQSRTHLRTMEHTL